MAETKTSETASEKAKETEAEKQRRLIARIEGLLRELKQSLVEKPELKS